MVFIVPKPTGYVVPSDGLHAFHDGHDRLNAMTPREVWRATKDHPFRLRLSWFLNAIKWALRGGYLGPLCDCRVCRARAVRRAWASALPEGYTLRQDYQGWWHWTAPNGESDEDSEASGAVQQAHDHAERVG